jgi:adenylate cyclase
VTDLPATHTFIFADLAGFTALTEAMGDEDAADLAEDFCAAVRALLPDHAAEEIKAIGDAVMLRAPEAHEAILLGLRVVHDVGGRHFFPTVRVGMNTGAAVERAGDWFGTTVNLAARVSGEAGGGETLLTETTRQAAGEVPGVQLHDRGKRTLKNVAEPLSLFAAVREGQRTESGLPIDPVCRMAVDPEHAAGRLLHEDVEYHFCSLQCAGRFAAAPGQYANATR